MVMAMRYLNFINKYADKFLALWLYLFIVVVIFSEVVRRFIIEFSSLWGEETARYSFIYMVWIGASIAVKDRLHIRIGILVDRLPNQIRNLFNIFYGVLGIFLAIIAIKYSIEPVLTSIKYQSVTDGLRIVQAWFLFAVPFGFSIILLRLVQVMIEDIQNFIAKQPPSSPKKLFD